MKRHISLILMFLSAITSQQCLAKDYDLQTKLNASMSLWEYERNSFISMIHLSDSESAILTSNVYNDKEEAQLLLAINCREPKMGGRFHALYQYRCQDKPLFYISSYALQDPYILAFVKIQDIGAALYYLGKYEEFLTEVQSSGKGIPIDVSYGEYVLEIKAFLEGGGIGIYN